MFQALDQIRIAHDAACWSLHIAAIREIRQEWWIQCDLAGTTSERLVLHGPTGITNFDVVFAIHRWLRRPPEDRTRLVQVTPGLAEVLATA
jgi:hypothetical protein